MDATATTRNRATIAISCLIALLGFATAIAASARDADAKSAKVLGKTKKTPKPSCPSPNKFPPPHKECQAVGQVTVLQKMADGVRNPYKVPKDGHLVAWGISLSKPSKEEYDFFTNSPPSGPSLADGVGWGPPSGKISVLKKAKEKKEFKLVKDTPKVQLDPYLGRDPIFTLRKPLRVKAGSFVALTTGTWFPAFAHNEPVTSKTGDVWLASRGKKYCGSNIEDVKHSKPHRKTGSTRKYGCTYTAGRLIYTAYFVPSGKKK